MHGSTNKIRTEQNKLDTNPPAPADQITPTGKAFAKRGMDPAGMRLQARCPGHSNLALQGRGEKRGEAP